MCQPSKHLAPLAPCCRAAGLEQQYVEQYFRGTGKITSSTMMWLGLYRAGVHLLTWC